MNNQISALQICAVNWDGGDVVFWCAAISRPLIFGCSLSLHLHVSSRWFFSWVPECRKASLNAMSKSINTFIHLVFFKIKF